MSRGLACSLEDAAMQLLEKLARRDQRRCTSVSLKSGFPPRFLYSSTHIMLFINRRFDRGFSVGGVKLHACFAWLEV